MRNDVSEPDTLWGTVLMSRDIVDKPASQLLFVLGCRFLLFCALGWVSLFPVGPLIVTGCVDVVLGDYFAGFGE